MTGIFIATPLYGPGHNRYFHMMSKLMPALSARGHSVQWEVLEGCCYVHTARNKLAAKMLLSGCERLVFIDSDIEITDIDGFVSLIEAEGFLIRGAVAPFRHGDGGFPAGFVRDMAGQVLSDNGFYLVDPLPTAVMVIERDALMRIVEDGRAPYRVEYHPGTMVERERYLSFFDFEVDEVNHLEYGEDVTFCRKWQAVGGQLWAKADLAVRHYGGSFREGCLIDKLADTKTRDNHGGSRDEAAASA